MSFAIPSARRLLTAPWSMGVLFAARLAGPLAPVVFIVASSLAMLLDRGKEEY